jgi:4-diphosphocytidyl-2-C-methyl-D-erythritol kinase
VLGFSVPERGRRLTVRARAKVNLGLEVLGRRPDGYHELRTLLVAVDLADRVTIETPSAGNGDAIEVVCSTAGVPAGPDNLAWRAAERVRREVGRTAGVRIAIDKAIPVAAGLGGGSADAAAVIAGLEWLWRLRWPASRRHALATDLGMDVPFFLGRGPALGAGRGEELTPVVMPRPLTVVVVNPGFPLATREVYGQLGPADWSTGAAVRDLVAGLAGGPRALAARLVNSLEGAVARLWPGLRDIQAALMRAGALGTVMSGSGPTVIGLASSLPAGRRIQAALGGGPWRVWVTRTISGPALTIQPVPPAGVTGRRVAAWGVAKR